MAFVFGTVGNDSLTGGTAGNDTFYAGLGHDTVVGSNGNDRIELGYASSAAYWRAGFPDNDFDRVRYDTLWQQNGYVNPADVRIVVDLALGTVQKFGQGEVSLGTDTVIGADGIIGTAGNDSMSGRATFEYEEYRGEGGNDTINGRGGIDAARYDSAAGAIVINLAAGTVTGDASVGSDTLREVEWLIGTGFDDSYNATGFGGASVNRHSWGEDWNFFLPGAGNDNIVGNGDTTVQYSNAGGGLVVNLGLQTAPGVSANIITNWNTGTFTNGIAPGNDLVSGVSGFRGSNFSDNITGGGKVNVALSVGQGYVTSVSGDQSGETFRGNGGNDTINGATGSDRADFNNQGVTRGVTINLAAGTAVGDPLIVGTDTLRGIEGTTGSHLDDRYDASGFTLSNAAAPSLNSGDLVAALPAGASLPSRAHNEFRPTAGNDEVIGNGATRVSFSNMLVENLAGVSVKATFTGVSTGSADYGLTDGGFGHVNFTGTYSIRAGLGNDSLVGSAGYQNLQGYFGNDTLLGGEGNDILFGHTGSDTQVNQSSNFSDNDSLLGGAGNDLIRADFGNDVLDGGTGIDTMFGGTGSDTYRVDDRNDQTTEATAGTAGGIDTVFSSVSRTLGANLERLTLTLSNPINGTGNTLANIITGNAAANILNGGGGNDQLNGGLGADDYRFTTALNTSTNVDSIVGFAPVDDRISLDDAVFTTIGPLGGLAAGAFVAGSAASAADDRIVYESATGRIYFDSDGSGAAAQVLFATVAAGTALTASDFFVV